MFMVFICFSVIMTLKFILKFPMFLFPFLLIKESFVVMLSLIPSAIKTYIITVVARLLVIKFHYFR